jgi:hypothetical protein
MNLPRRQVTRTTSTRQGGVPLHAANAILRMRSSLESAKQAQANRVRNQVNSNFGRTGGQFGRSGDSFARGATGGAVQRLGGDPLTPRQFQGTGAVGVGSPVQFNQGIATGRPFTPNEAEIPLADDPSRALLTDDVPGSNFAPRYNVDFAIKQDQNRAIEAPNDELYYWDDRTGEAIGRWVKLGGSEPPDPVGYVTVMFPEEGITYPLINASFDALKIEDRVTNFAEGSGTASFNYNVGETIPQGGSLTVAFSGLSVDASEDPPLVTAQGFTASFKFSIVTPTP